MNPFDTTFLNINESPTAFDAKFPDTFRNGKNNFVLSEQLRDKILIAYMHKKTLNHK